MKRILLAIFVSVPFLTMAQSIQLSDMRIEADQSVENLYVGKLTVTNVSEAAIEIMVKKEVIELGNPEHVAYFCWASCYGPATTVSPTAKTISAGGFDDNSFSGDLDSYGYAATTRVKYTFYNKNNPNDKAEYTFVYFDPNGIAVSQASADMLSNLYPNPVQSVGKLSYNLSGKHFNEANLVVRNLTGAVVKNVKLSDNKGELSLNVAEMNNGIYMYSLVLDGKAVLTRKMTVVGN